MLSPAAPNRIMSRVFIVDALGQTLLRRQNSRLGCLKDAIEPPHHDKGQDHLAIFGLLEVAAQDVRNRPDERAEVLNACGFLDSLIHNAVPSRFWSELVLARSPALSASEEASLPTSPGKPSQLRKVRRRLP